MYIADIEYNYPVFRPPGEANSLILQLSYGCSWNKCLFCEMYTSRQFRIRKMEEIIAEIKKIKSSGQVINKVFLADGDAFTLKTVFLLEILNEINAAFPFVRKISAYAKPKDLLKKTRDELSQLRSAGLNLLYIGLETGDDEVLKLINKGETHQSMSLALNHLKGSGIKSSVMIINGLGGKEFSSQHAIQSAKLINEIQPDYLSTLVLSFPFGLEHYRKRLNTEFVPLKTMELIEELGIMISQLNLRSSIFRSDHASNYLILKGVLNKDKENILHQIHTTILQGEKADLRKEWERGL